MLIVNNFHAFPSEWKAATGERGSSCQARNAREFLKIKDGQSDVLFLVNCDPRLTFELSAAKMAGMSPAPLVSADLVLRVPCTMAEKAAWALKKPLLKQVDLFIHYFRDFRRYSEAFGIAADRNEFVPFKANLGRRQAELQSNPDGEYVLCFGRSLRDFDTFFGAMEKLPYPAAIARVDPAQLRAHHARFTRAEKSLPPNVRVLDDDGSEAAQIRILGGARIVVLPILKASVVASGISTCLNAMLLGKCVVGSEGPGMSDVFDREIVTVPPEDPQALSAAIRRVWEDDHLRFRTAAAGHEYALRMGGEQELYQRIIDVIALWYRRRKTSQAWAEASPVT